MIWIFLGNSMIIIFKKVAKTINDFSNRQHILKCFMIMMQHAYWLIGVKFSQLKITSVWRRSMDFKTAHAAVLSFLDYILQKGVKVNRYHVGSDESWTFSDLRFTKLCKTFTSHSESLAKQCLRGSFTGGWNVKCVEDMHRVVMP